MIQGIGVDLTEIKEIKRLAEETGGVFTARTFTQREQEGAAQAADRWEYLAGRYAAKEAVFKALAHLTPEKTFDFRKIETCSSEDGSPYVVLPPILRKAMKEAGGKRCHQTVLVCDFSFFQRHVKIAPAKHAFALYIDVVY